jgi:hypothetical protein
LVSGDPFTDLSVNVAIVIPYLSGLFMHQCK